MPLIILIGFIFVIGTLLKMLSGAKQRFRGKLGERIVSRRLQAGLPVGTYSVIDDIYLPIKEKGTTQIDHIVVSRFGVFVIETKNYSGWIFASADSPTWTQTIYHEKNMFQNPIRQNYRHLSAISENLGIPMEYLQGIVAFTGDCTFKTEMPRGVVYSDNLATLIKSYDKVLLKDLEVVDIVSALREWGASVTTEQRRSHVKNLCKSHAQARVPVGRKSVRTSSFLTCPKCGAPLATRNRRSDRAQFYGCSNYPRCHYTRPVDL